MRIPRRRKDGLGFMGVARGGFGFKAWQDEVLCILARWVHPRAIPMARITRVEQDSFSDVRPRGWTRRVARGFGFEAWQIGDLCILARRVPPPCDVDGVDSRPIGQDSFSDVRHRGWTRHVARGGFGFKAWLVGVVWSLARWVHTRAIPMAWIRPIGRDSFSDVRHRGWTRRVARGGFGFDKHSRPIGAARG
jgi:hypothetical protein